MIASGNLFFDACWLPLSRASLAVTFGSLEHALNATVASTVTTTMEILDIMRPAITRSTPSPLLGRSLRFVVGVERETGKRLSIAGSLYSLRGGARHALLLQGKTPGLTPDGDGP